MTDGILIAIEDLNPGSKKTVVLVHGWPIRKEMYEYQKDILVDAGYRIVSYDIRGFGDSEASAGNYNYNQLAQDLKKIIDSLDTDAIYLVGYSMGAAICIRYMSLFNNWKVSKLVLLGAAVPSFDKTENNPYGHTRESTNKLIANLYSDRPKEVSDFGDKVFAKKHSSEFISWFRNLCYSASGVGTIKTAISLRDEDLYNDLLNIKVPTIIMHGKLDKICPFNFTEIMVKGIKNSILDPFEQSGHGLLYDELSKLNHDLIEFLEQN